MRYQVYDPARGDLLLETNSKWMAQGWAKDAVNYLHHNIALADTLALPGEVDLWTVNEQGELHPVTVKH